MVMCRGLRCRMFMPDMWAIWLPPKAVPMVFDDSEPFVFGCATAASKNMKAGMLAAADELAIGADHENCESIRCKYSGRCYASGWREVFRKVFRLDVRAGN